jgi:hypothetical protein
VSADTPGNQSCVFTIRFKFQCCKCDAGYALLVCAFSLKVFVQGEADVRTKAGEAHVGRVVLLKIQFQYLAREFSHTKLEMKEWRRDLFSE